MKNIENFKAGALNFSLSKDKHFISTSSSIALMRLLLFVLLFFKERVKEKKERGKKNSKTDKHLEFPPKHMVQLKEKLDSNLLKKYVFKFFPYMEKGKNSKK